MGRTFTAIEILVGLTFTKVEMDDPREEILFETTDRRFKMLHRQDCCESVLVEDICGDLSDLVGSPLLMAEESTNTETDPEGYEGPHDDDTFTWTFYRFRTAKGDVTIRWLGESNGYYGEDVDLIELTD